MCPRSDCILQRPTSLSSAERVCQTAAVLIQEQSSAAGRPPADQASPLPGGPIDTFHCRKISLSVHRAQWEPDCESWISLMQSLFICGTVRNRLKELQKQQRSAKNACSELCKAAESGMFGQDTLCAPKHMGKRLLRARNLRAEGLLGGATLHLGNLFFLQQARIYAYRPCN